jgi:prepilin-type N-terminal cleavage/methylation domain-containing protein
MKISLSEKQKGFTLIELLVVIAIIGVLASVVIANTTETQLAARDAARYSDMRQIRVALELFYNANGRYPDFTHDNVDTRGEFIGVGDDIDIALQPYIDPVPRDPRHDGVVHFYSYDSWHIVELDCDAVAPWRAAGVVWGFNRAESGSTGIQKQTCKGGNMNLHDADYNQAIITQGR